MTHLIHDHGAARRRRRELEALAAMLGDPP
jgi:hypothetical protein